MKRTRLNPISKKKLAQMKADLPTREALCNRCGGMFAKTSEIMGVCVSGWCEYCNQHTWELHPHEEVFRSQGGELSLANSKMACSKCHDEKHEKGRT